MIMPSMDQGNYWGVPKEWGTGKSEKKQTPYFFITFSIAHMKVAGGWKEIAPAERTVYFYLTDAAIGIAHEALSLHGFNGDFGNPEFGQEFEQGLELYCKHEAYDGKTKERWSFSRHRTIEHKALDANEIRRLNAIYKHMNKTSGGNGPGPSAPTPKKASTKPAHAAKDAGNDDIPF